MRVIPSACLLVILTYLCLRAVVEMVVTGYHPLNPSGYLAAPRFLTIVLAGVAGLWLLVRHFAALGPDGQRLSLARSMTEVALLSALVAGGYLSYAVAMAPAPQRLVSYAGETYAIPIGYGPLASSLSSGGNSLSFSVCGDAATPFYETRGCDQWDFALTTDPLLANFTASQALQGAGATFSATHIQTPGALQQTGDGYVHVDRNRQTYFATDSTGKVLSFQSCWLEGALDCQAGVLLSEGRSALLSIPAGRSDPAGEARRYLTMLDGWRCPQATGCVPK
jgi:hypothetical protein